MNTKHELLITSIIEFVDLLSIQKEDENTTQQISRFTAEHIGEFIRKSAQIYEVDLREPLPFDKTSGILCEEIKHNATQDGITTTHDTPQEYMHISAEQRELFKPLTENKLNQNK